MGTTDDNCAKCANEGYAWWPCNTVLCTCGATIPTSISSPAPISNPTPNPPTPTPRPTPNPPSPTPRPTPTPNSQTPSPPTSTTICGTWNQVCPGCADCTQCKTDPSKWQCGEGDPT